MDNGKQANANDEFEQALEELANSRYVLKLFVAGNTSRSIQAIESIREICETRLRGRYTLEVIDIYQQTELAREAQIIAAPTLIKSLPLPLRRVIGNLSSIERILVGLNLEPVPGEPAHDGPETGRPDEKP